MEYSDLLFDIDNTLLDFKNGSREAFSLTFSALGLDHSDEVYSIYNTINSRIWKQFESNQIDAITLRYQRFDDTLKALGIAGLDGKEMSRLYLDNLIQTTTLYPEVKQLLHDLAPYYRLHVITNGLREVQRARLARLGISDLFSSVTVSDEIGVAKPHSEYFDHVFTNAPITLDRTRTLVIGDSLTSDIQGGNNYGLDTCWITHGKENTTSIIPTYSIQNVGSIRDLLKF